jgi:hypothetical protein
MSIRTEEQAAVFVIDGPPRQRYAEDGCKIARRLGSDG